MKKKVLSILLGALMLSSIGCGKQVNSTTVTKEERMVVAESEDITVICLGMDHKEDCEAVYFEIEYTGGEIVGITTSDTLVNGKKDRLKIEDRQKEYKIRFSLVPLKTKDIDVIEGNFVITKKTDYGEIKEVLPFYIFQ